jgi:hypothetical protein
MAWKNLPSKGCWECVGLGWGDTLPSLMAPSLLVQMGHVFRFSSAISASCRQIVIDQGQLARGEAGEGINQACILEVPISPIRGGFAMHLKTWSSFGGSPAHRREMGQSLLPAGKAVNRCSVRMTANSAIGMRMFIIWPGWVKLRGARDGGSLSLRRQNRALQSLANASSRFACCPA